MQYELHAAGYSAGVHAHAAGAHDAQAHTRRFDAWACACACACAQTREDTYAAIRKLLALLDDPFTRHLPPARLEALRKGSAGELQCSAGACRALHGTCTCMHAGTHSMVAWWHGGTRRHFGAWMAAYAAPCPALCVLSKQRVAGPAPAPMPAAAWGY